MSREAALQREGRDLADQSRRDGRGYEQRRGGRRLGPSGSAEGSELEEEMRDSEIQQRSLYY